MITTPSKEQQLILLKHYQSGNLNETIKLALSLTKNFPNHSFAWKALALSYEKTGKILKSLDANQKAKEINPLDAEIHNNLGNILKKLEKFDEAQNSYRQAILLKQNYTEVYYNLGNLLKELSRFDEAEKNYNQAIKFRPNFAVAFNNLGILLKELSRFDESIVNFKESLKIDPELATAKAEILFLEASIGDHSNFKNLDKESSRLGISTKSVEPFPALSWHDDPEKQLKRSKLYATENFKEIKVFKSNKIKSLNNKIKIGYFSNDFYNHATMYLISGMLANHNHNIFEIFIFSYGPNKDDIMNKKARDFADHYIDISGLSINEILKITEKLKLDIAIDLKGYTKKSLIKIFQYRIAPIQINFLGYPGTLGVDFIDYIIADPIIIPEDQKHFYHEKIIYLPHTYQPNDNKREIADLALKRSDFNLPDKGFVFCCFNQIYKISPKEFNIWMRLLKKVNHSVLWLIKSNKWVEQNLSKEAKQQGIDPSRIVFAEKLSHSKHLARHKHADLFIDTFNINAHTTASDALWAGLPIVTKQGKQFSARVASSLLTACGLPELITKNEKEYEELIYELATNPKKLKTISLKLSENKKSKPLFNTKQYTNNFENGSQKTYDLYFNGEHPKDIFVSEN